MTRHTRVYTSKFHVAVFETVKEDGRLRHRHINDLTGKTFGFHMSKWRNFMPYLRPGEVYASMQFGVPGTYDVHALTHLGRIPADKFNSEIMRSASEYTREVNDIQRFLERTKERPQDNLAFCLKVREKFGDILDDHAHFRATMTRILEMTSAEREALAERVKYGKYLNNTIELPAQIKHLHEHFEF